MDAFDGAVEAGVSRELTEALIALVRGTEGARIAVEWAPAAGVPDGCAAGAEPVEFSPGDLPVLREAGARYLREEPSVPVRITGTVVRMRRSGPRGDGQRTAAGAGRRRGPARPADPRRGGLPHRRPRPPRRTAGAGAAAGWRAGAASGGSPAPAGSSPVQVDEAERDRLMKSLQENVDFFEEACGGDE